VSNTTSQKLLRLQAENHALRRRLAARTNQCIHLLDQLLQMKIALDLAGLEVVSNAPEEPTTQEGKL
jgi:hypothetical protein